MNCRALTIVTLLTLGVVGRVLSEGGQRFNPYNILNVGQSATSKEIKTAYKKLVKEWHPDKSDDPKAEAKFIEITKAYAVLTDSSKKAKYDRYGTFDEGDDNRGQPDFGFFSDFGFNSFYSTTQKYAKHRVSYGMYHGTILSKSYQQPFIMLVYSDFCLPCAQIEPIWERLVADLDPIGYGIAAVNNYLDHRLVAELHVKRLPSFVVLVEGNAYLYKGPPMSVAQIIKFAKSVIPVRHVQRITTYSSLKRFLEDWETTSKVSVLMLAGSAEPRLRYQLAAMRYHDYARFAYVRMIGDKDTEQLRNALGIRRGGETLLIFNETPENGAVATLASSVEISADSIKNIMENNKYLTVPRISSQERFDDLCPATVTERSLKAGGQLRLCCILLVDDLKREAFHLRAFRSFVGAQRAFAPDRVRFAFVMRHSQRAFVDALANADAQRTRRSNSQQQQADSTHTPAESDDDKSDIIVVWRTDQRRVKFEWLAGIWDGRYDAEINKSEHDLVTKVEQFLRGKAVLGGSAILQELMNENGPGWLTRLSRRTSQMWDAAVFTLTQDEVLPMVSALGTLLFILALGYGLSYMSNAELRSTEERRRAAAAERARNRTTAVPPSSSDDNTPAGAPTVKRNPTSYGNLLHELRAETYFGLIRLLKPGCRSFVIIVDDASKDLLLHQFYKIVWPWRNNKTLSFGYLVVPKNIAWFRSLLQHTLPSDDAPPTDTTHTATADVHLSDVQKRLNNINPKQTLGTVLAINGWRLYFSIYHPMHAPSMIGFKKNKHKQSNGATKTVDCDDDDYSSTDTEEELATREEVEAYQKKNKKSGGFKVEDVLSGLPNFLDRLFEGSCRRYYIPEWPDNMK